MPEQVTLTLAGQDADILLNYCSTEDITGKPSTQLRAPVPVSILNPNREVIIRKMFDNMMQANWNRQFGLLNKSVLLSDCNQSEFADASVSRGEQTGIIITGVPFLLSPIPGPFFPTSFFSFLPSPPPLTPAMQAIHLQILISLGHLIFLSKSSLPGRLSSAAVVVVVVDTWCSTLFDRLSWFSNRTGTSDKGQHAEIKQLAWPMTGRRTGHRRSSLVLFGTFPWSNDVPVLLLNQPNDSKGVDQTHCEGLLHWVYNSWSLARILSETPVPCLWLADYHQEISWRKIAWHWQITSFTFIYWA